MENVCHKNNWHCELQLAGTKLSLTDKKIGVLAGLGFIANIPIQGDGVFTINAEWRLNFL